MKDFKYLNHSFKEDVYIDFIFKCEKCNVLIWNSGIEFDFKYWIVNQEFYNTGKIIKLTCEEMIIKKLLE